MNDYFDENKASSDELWEWCIKEYSSNNPITKFLLNNFYSKINKVIKLLDSHDKILEVGCGAGESSLRIFKMLSGQQFEASEVDPRYITKLKENNFPINVSQESVYQLKRDDNEFDCVLLLEVLEHLERPDTALKELFRVSKKYVVVSVPNEPIFRVLNMVRGKYLKNYGNTPGHINHWTPSGIKKLISNYGKIKTVYTPLPWIIIVAESNKNMLYGSY